MKLVTSLSSGYHGQDLILVMEFRGEVFNVICKNCGYGTSKDEKTFFVWLKTDARKNSLKMNCIFLVEESGKIIVQDIETTRFENISKVAEVTLKNVFEA